MELFPIFDENVAVASNIWYSLSGFGESPFMRVGHTALHIRRNNEKSDDEDKGELLFIGGANPSGSFNEIFAFDLNTSSWDKVEDLPGFEAGRYEHACFKTKTNNEIYIFGGSNETETLNDVLKFNLLKAKEGNNVDSEEKSNKKKKKEKEPEKKESSHSELNITCEKISNEDNEESSNQPSRRTLHTACSYKDQLVVFGGGINGKQAVQDQKLYIFSPKTKKWLAIQPKNKQEENENANKDLQPSVRHGHVMINQNDEYIYLHGGMSGDEIFDDLWQFDLRKLTWSRIESEKQKHPLGRAAHSGISVGDRNLYFFGGIGKQGSLDDIWKFNTETDEWSEIEIFGYKPPGRLDFAYCKASFSNPISDNTKEEDKDKDKCKEKDNNKDKKTTKEETEAVAEIPLTIQPLKIQAENEDEEKEKRNESEQENKIKKELCDFLVVHGGMDTEGNIFDDMFLIKLD